MTAEDVIDRLGLVPLPGEGGFYRETFRSAGVLPPSALPARYTSGERRWGTAIYYLLTPETYSALHRLQSDEMYHFYAGDPVEMLTVDGDLTAREVVLSNRLIGNEQCQWLVPAGVWQGSRLSKGGAWALLGTTVVPGFEFADWALASAGEIAAWPAPIRARGASLLANPS